MTEELEKKMRDAANANAFDIDCGDLNTNRDIFIDAIKWYINNLWHEEDLPNKDEDIIIRSGGFAKVCSPNEAYEYTGQKTWCYLCDILPKEGGTK